MDNSKITVESLNLHYGENHALKNVNMEIADHAIPHCFVKRWVWYSNSLILSLCLSMTISPMAQDYMASRIKRNWMRSWNVPCRVPLSSKK